MQLAVQTNETMTSSQLADLLQIEKKEVNRKIKDMFQQEIDGGEIPPSLDARGYVTEYHLNELHSTMFVGKWHNPFLRQLAQFWIDRKKPQETLPVLSEIEMIAAVATNLVKQQKAIEATQAQDKSIGSDVENIKAKVDKFNDLASQLKFGYLPIKEAWLKHCNICSYDVFREFADIFALPKYPLEYVPVGTVVIVNSHQVKVADVIKMKHHILNTSVQKSAHYWEHPDLNHRFKLRN